MVAEQRIQEKTTLPRPRVVPTQDRSGDSGNAPRPRRAMAHTGPRVLRRAKAIQENSRVPGAVLLATFTVTILCLYLCAYASVTAEGFELSRLRSLNKQADLQRDTLQAEISRLSLPQTVAQRAKELGMEPGTPQTLTIVSDKSAGAAPPQLPIR
jgi:cell division protein FtsL